MVKKKTNSEFVDEVVSIVGHDYTFLDRYINSRSKIRVIHNKCGHQYTVTPNQFLRGGRCPNCYGNSANLKTTDQFKKEVYQLVGDEYTILGEYKSRKTNIDIRHNKCGRVYKVEPGNFLGGSRCIQCYYQSMRLTTEEINRRIIECLGSEYYLVSGESYTSSQKKTKVHHDRCNRDFYVRVDDINQKRSGCPYCSSSRGEDYIRSTLLAKNIKFEEQVKFDDLVDTNKLSYDFMVPNLKLLIEYQGSQHYYPKTWGGMSKQEALSRLELQKKHDKLKRSYALENGYKLIEISYKYDSYSKVSNYLDKFL